ncbi:protein FAM133B-like [Palaemon carinicauda]|uniref:protein FAM133B-like n=1 Tax=Palaemon carinicauda TaxID=392227 RepID=UPI0035B58E0A
MVNFFQLKKLSRMNWKRKSIFLLKKRSRVNWKIKSIFQWKNSKVSRVFLKEHVDEEKEEKEEEEKVLALEEHRSVDDSKAERSDKILSKKKRSNKKLSKSERSKRELSKAERKNSNLSKEQSSNEDFSEEEERLDSDIYEVPVHNYYSLLSGKDDMDRSPLKKSSHKSERKKENKKKRGRGGRCWPKIVQLGKEVASLVKCSSNGC